MKQKRMLAQFVAAICLLPFGSSWAALTTTPAPLASPLTPGKHQIVTVYVINDGTTAEKFVAPNAIAAKLVFGERETAVTLVPEVISQSYTIEPGKFVAVRCGVTVPEDASPKSLVVIAPSAGSSAVAEEHGASGSTPEPVGPRHTVAEAGLVEYRPLQFSAHEPIYFLLGTERPNGKFQLSFKYQVIPTDSPLGQKAPWMTGFHLGYTQVSFWDLEGDSKPFFDSSYKPELMWLWDNIRPEGWRAISRIDLQLGLQHESNGRSGEDSRSLNIAYVRPVVTFGDRNDWFVSVGPRVWTYVASKDDNDDIDQYRGYGDLKVVAGKGDGLQVAMVGRMGSDWDKGSLQVDVSYPIRKALFDSIDVYLHGQLFTGFGESLLQYDDSDTNFRVGISLVR